MNPACFTVASGTCGKTNWTSTNPGAIATTSYTYPTTTTINGTGYTLDGNSLTGCNQGMGGAFPEVCSVSVAQGSTATITATYHLTVPPTPSCTSSLPNLVQNSSFETVTGPGDSLGDWYVSDPALSSVPHWAHLTQGGSPDDIVQGTTGQVGIPAYQGTRFVVVGTTAYGVVQGVVGDLSSPLVAGATYVITARVAMHLDVPQSYPNTFTDFHLGLRNSSTGALGPMGPSASMHQVVSHWTLITATVTPYAVFDQVVVKADTGEAAIAMIDDVHVRCKAGSSMPWWMIWGGGIALVSIGSLGGVTWRRRRARKLVATPALAH